jgi:hypothetical protein
MSGEFEVNMFGISPAHQEKIVIAFFFNSRAP